MCWFHPIPGPLPSGLPEGVKLHLPTSKAARSSAPSPHPGHGTSSCHHGWMAARDGRVTAWG